MYNKGSKLENIGKTLEFKEWISQVDVLMVKDYFISHLEVADYDWVSEFEAGTSPEEAYREWDTLSYDGLL